MPGKVILLLIVVAWRRLQFIEAVLHECNGKMYMSNNIEANLGEAEAIMLKCYLICWKDNCATGVQRVLSICLLIDMVRKYACPVRV